MQVEALEAPKTECPNCMGRGWHGAYSIHKTCGSCNGSGQVEKKNMKLKL